MSRDIQHEDFVGFSFNNAHSSTFGIKRVSDSNRYEGTLVPGLSNSSEQIPGGWGEVYYGEELKSRQFKISFAFDDLSETELRKLKLWLHPDGDLHELIFDERPYVKYFVKCNKEVVQKSLCFMEDGERVYKGEGNIEFVSFTPYGVEVSKFLEDFGKDGPFEAENFDEWEKSSGLYFPHGGYNTWISGSNLFMVYNPGDTHAECTITFEVDASGAQDLVPLDNPDWYDIFQERYETYNDQAYICYKTYFYKVQNDSNGYYFIDNANVRHNGILNQEETRFIYDLVEYKFYSNPGEGRFGPVGRNIYFRSSSFMSLDPNERRGAYVNTDKGTFFATVQWEDYEEDYQVLYFIDEDFDDITAPTKITMGIAGTTHKIYSSLNGVSQSPLILEVPALDFSTASYPNAVQKAILYGGKIKVDGFKKGVFYQQNDDSPWEAITDIVKSGEFPLVKRREDQLQSTTGFRAQGDQLINFVNITYGGEGAPEIKSGTTPTISYHYYYL